MRGNNRRADSLDTYNLYTAVTAVLSSTPQGAGAGSGGACRWSKPSSPSFSGRQAGGCLSGAFGGPLVRRREFRRRPEKGGCEGSPARPGRSDRAPRLNPPPRRLKNPSTRRLKNHASGPRKHSAESCANPPRPSRSNHPERQAGHILGARCIEDTFE